jgi:RNA polymerase sigma-70 factor (ECF subfamily)
VIEMLPEACVNPLSADLDLARQAAADVPGAREAVLGRVLDRVRASVYYLAGRDRDVDDLVQLALLDVLAATGAYRGEAPLERWADRIAVRSALKRLGRRRRREQIVTLPGDPPADQPAESEDGLLRRELRGLLAEHLAKLSEERRTAVILHLVHGYSVQEVAEATSAPVNTVRDRLQTGRKLLLAAVKRDPRLRDFTGAVRDHGAS